MTEVRVCEAWVDNGPNKKRGFALEIALKNNLDILLKNIMDDWDFTIIVAGGGEVRVGKSVLAMQIAAYLHEQMWVKYKKKTLFNVDRSFVFSGADLIKKGHYLGQNYPYSPLIFDEAGADLEGRKVMSATTKLVLDYFRECGQYNLFNILVIPEFFDLPRGIALSRSIFLVNVTYGANAETGKFLRGHFNFYSRRKKKRLYLYGKKDLNYNASTYDFKGRFYKSYPIDQEKYDKMKLDALMSRDKNKVDFKELQRDACLNILRHDCKVSMQEMERKMKQWGGPLSVSTISKVTRLNDKESLGNEPITTP